MTETVKETEMRNSRILSLMQDKTVDYGERIALGIKGLYGWREITYKGLSLLAEKTARYLIEDLEFKKGDGIAILSESKPEYGACVFASTKGVKVLIIAQYASFIIPPSSFAET